MHNMHELIKSFTCILVLHAFSQKIVSALEKNVFSCSRHGPSGLLNTMVDVKPASSTDGSSEVMCKFNIWSDWTGEFWCM